MNHTDTVSFWKGDFGNEYSERNSADPRLAAQTLMFWARILRLIPDPEALGKVLEVGCNIGRNIAGLRQLLGAELFAVEPNDHARQIARESGVLDAAHVLEGTSRALPFADGEFGLAFTKGVLIHVAPADLEASVREIHRVSRDYIFCAEYFADKPVEVPYRDHAGVLFKRDWGSLYMDLFPDLKLVDCGFEWRRTTGMDNLTWWLFRK